MTNTEKMELLKSIKIGEVFHCINSYGKTFRAIKQPYYEICVFAPKSRKRGWFYKPEDFITTFDIKPKSATNEGEQWKKRLKRAVKILDESGLWDGKKEFFQNLLMVDYIDLQDIRRSFNWTDESHKELYEQYGRKYPFMFFKALDEKFHFEPDYISGLSECRLKSMYFGKTRNTEIKERLAAAMERKENFNERAYTSYDVSVEYNPDTKRAWYSEEYKGCGNGHYYLALDANTAVFCEDD